MKKLKILKDIKGDFTELRKEVIRWIKKKN